MQAAARRHGIPTPMSDHLVALVTTVETGEHTLGMELAQELARTARARDPAPALP